MADVQLNKAAKIIELDEAGIKTQLRRFDDNWSPMLLDEFAKKLPGPDHPLRLQVLEDVIVLDLKNHWKRGLEKNILDYPGRFPEISLVDLLQVLKERDLSLQFPKKTQESLALVASASQGDIRLDTKEVQSELPLV